MPGSSTMKFGLILAIHSLFIASGVNSVFVSSCIGDNDCSVNKPTGSSFCDFSSDSLFIRNTCSVGTCLCNDGFAPTIDGCSPLQELPVGAQCRGSNVERYPFFAYCRSFANASTSVVSCPENMRYSPSSMPPGCKDILPVKKFGETCDLEKNWCDSTVGLYCPELTKKCTCSDQNSVWRDDHCTLDRVYGDPCRVDTDCSPPTGSSSMGMMCERGVCVCQPDHIVRIFTTKTKKYDHTVEVRYRLMCLNDTISAPSEPDQRCHMIPDSSNSTVTASTSFPVRYCWHDSVCFKCPGDPSSITNPLMGKCFKLSNPPAIPPELLKIFWEFFSGNVPTVPPTRPPEPSTVTRPEPITPLAPNGKGDGSGKFGDVCWADSDCHESAFCLVDLANTIHPPCAASICVCRHGNEPDVYGSCQPVRHLLVGDICKNPILEILPPGTACENGKVVCDSPRFVQDDRFNTQCVLAVTLLTFGQYCTVGDNDNHCDSAAGLDCLPSGSADPWRVGSDSSTRCWCSIGMWDGSACQVSDYGEICRVNTDCRGYPLAGVICDKGLCICQAGYRPFRTLQLILMQRESLGPGGSLSNPLGAASLYRQTVCVNENTTMVSSLRGTCSALIDPRAGAQLCRDGLFCFRCPKPANGNSGETAALLSQGTCRTLNLLSTSGLDMFGRNSEDPHLIRGSINLESGTIGKSCSRDSDCNIYQQCSKPPTQPSFFNSTYDCKLGYCVCQSGYGLDVNQLCRPFVNLKLGQWCSLSTTNSLYPENAGCYFGKVGCNYPYVAKNGLCQLNAVTRIRNFNESCSDKMRDVCRMPLVCQWVEANNDMSCTCPDDTEVWDSTTSSCRRRQYGDWCSQSSQCDNGEYAALGQALCNKSPRNPLGTCGCLPGKSYAAEVTRWDAVNGVKVTAQICLDNIVGELRRTGTMGMCSMRLVQRHGASPMSIVHQGGLCNSGLLCHQCPDDRDEISPSYGYCRPLQ